MKRIKDAVKNNLFKNVYLFYGDENYLKKFYLDKIKDTLVSKNMEIMNIDIYDGKSVLSKNIIDSCETMPFMNNYRVVFVKNSELFIQGRKDESEKTAEYIKNIPNHIVLVFSEDKIDKRGKLYKAVSSKGECIEFKTPSEKEMISWVKKLAVKNQKKISDTVALHFLRTVNNSMEALLGEFEKLLDYKINSDEIKKEDINAICTKSLETKIFDMVDAIGNKKTSEALDIYNNMILFKESPIMILSMIARQFRLILQSKYLEEKRFSKDEIASKLGQRGFVINECLRQSKNFKKKSLLEALKDCLECDINIKTGKIHDKTAVEMIILKYSGHIQ